MIHILTLAMVTALGFPGFPATKWKKCDSKTGHFVRSAAGPVAGPHGIHKRNFNFAPVPSLKGLKKGWNYTMVNKKKHGLQIYSLGGYVIVEYFVHGKKRATATYRKGKPGGWFNQYDEQGKKHGLQHYATGAYRGLELYNHGVRVRTGAYQESLPNGWFFQYNSHRQKHGVQKYVGKNSWKIEHYEKGKQHGHSGAYSGRVKHGWHYLYSHGKLLKKTYYIKGVAR